nr:hypothetical protein X990_4992 [Burkholderia pseudomallei MSHR4868]
MSKGGRTADTRLVGAVRSAVLGIVHRCPSHCSPQGALFHAGALGFPPNPSPLAGPGGALSGVKHFLNINFIEFYVITLHLRCRNHGRRDSHC